jgi:hypothetical protein
MLIFFARIKFLIIKENCYLLSLIYISISIESSLFIYNLIHIITLFTIYILCRNILQRFVFKKSSTTPYFFRFIVTTVVIIIISLLFYFYSPYFGFPFCCRQNLMCTNRTYPYVPQVRTYTVVRTDTYDLYTSNIPIIPMYLMCYFFFEPFHFSYR